MKAGPVDTPIEVKIGQLVMAGIPGPTVAADARHLIRDLHVGNVILMGRNVESPAQVLALTRDLQELALAAHGLPLLIATDQEGGQVQRLNTAAGFLGLPSAAAVGACRSPEAIRRYARAAGEEMHAVGVNVAFAPVLDVADNPNNPVIGRRGRSFGSTPQAVAAAAIPFIRGLRDAGVLATAKHFPGHGSTTQDSHRSLPTVAKDRAALAEVELPPFQRAIVDGIDLILTAHVTYPALDPAGTPATLSRPTLDDLLRRDLGFPGLIVTDDLEMAGIARLVPPAEAAVCAIEAGADLVLCVRKRPSLRRSDVVESIVSALREAVRVGRLSPERIDESFRRIVELKTRHALGPPTGDDLDRIGGADHRRALADLGVGQSHDDAVSVRHVMRDLGDRVRSRRGLPA
jgi:beta-N-acetylhexosaminidase